MDVYIGLYYGSLSINEIMKTLGGYGRAGLNWTGAAFGVDEFLPSFSNCMIMAFSLCGL